MTNLAPRLHSNGRGIGRRQQLLSCRRAFASSTRASSGARVRAPAHLCRAPVEPTNLDVAAFYAKLLPVLKDTDVLRNGDWSQIEPLAAWSGNRTAEGFVAYAWTSKDGGRYVAAINYSENQGQCYLLLPFHELRDTQTLLTDLMGKETYRRDGSDLIDRGLYNDQTAWQFNLFEIRNI
jgi:hypothetical protein